MSCEGFGCYFRSEGTALIVFHQHSLTPPGKDVEVICLTQRQSTLTALSGVCFGLFGPKQHQLYFFLNPRYAFTELLNSKLFKIKQTQVN